MNDSNEQLLSPQEQGSRDDSSIVTEENTVKMWRQRIKDAKNFYEPDFKRMRENMEFAAGIQWLGQESIDDKEDRYIANIITQHVNSKVASLYAKDPQCEAKRRERMIYQLWDGSVESEWAAQAALMQSGMAGMMTPQAAQAQQLLADIQQGKQWEQLCAKVGKALEILYGYQCDSQTPTFKKQMKQLVRRVITTGVGYVRLNFVRSLNPVLTSSLTDDSLSFRIKRAKAIMAGIVEDEIPENDPRIEQLRLLLESVQSSVQQGEANDIEERLEFDFPSSTSIIVDPKCKSLKGFIGADWIAQQYIMPLETANSYFELHGEDAVKSGGEFVAYADDANDKPRPTDQNKPVDTQKDPLGCFWEVFDYTTKEHFFICDGWKWYVQAPQPVEPNIRGFWPIFGLTFNDVEVEPGSKVHIYPPSDVQLLKPMQKERNRSRQELREHRKVNRPFFWTQKGWASEEDLDKFANHETGELVQLAGSPVNGDMNNAIGSWKGTPIDQSVYSTIPMDEDARQAVGSNQIQMQGNLNHTAATPAVIQEQARMGGVSSNVDDLDDLLSDLAQAGGEIMLRNFTVPTVKRIAGQGAVWPDQQREDFINEVYLSIVAASSGRPNKAVDIQNAQQLVPMLLQAGANPWGLIRYMIKVLDSNLDVADFAPSQPPMMGMAASLQQTPAPNSTQKPGNVGLQQGGSGFPAGVQQGGLH